MFIIGLAISGWVVAIWALFNTVWTDSIVAALVTFVMVLTIKLAEE